MKIGFIGLGVMGKPMSKNIFDLEPNQSFSAGAGSTIEYNIYIDAATDYISAASADAESALHLEIELGEPLLLVRRISYRGGEPIEYADLRIIAERYEYSVHTTDRPPQGLQF